jgi:phosphatidylglycerol---prolipoprotein diacylglyceryl transferase
MYPILFRLSGLTVYAYGFFLATGFVLGLVLAVLKARKAGIPFEKVIDLFFLTVLSAIAGARVLFVLTNLTLYLNNPLAIFRLWEGGLVFYGGFVLAAAVAIVYLRIQRLPVWKLADACSPAISLGLFFGRIGCFFAGCCYGCQTSLPFGVIFTNERSLAPLHVPLHPTQLYDAANGLVIFVFLLVWEKRKAFDGQVFWLFLLLYSCGRFFVEMFRGDPRGSIFNGLLSTSQGLGLFLAIGSLFMLFYFYHHYRR